MAGYDDFVEVVEEEGVRVRRVLTFWFLSGGEDMAVGLERRRFGLVVEKAGASEGGWRVW